MRDGRYPGTSPDKDCARMWLYRLAAQGPLIGHAVTLAGQDPIPEMYLMRDFLGWPATRAWFIDWAKNSDTRSSVVKGLRALEREWPGVRTACCDINHVVSELGGIGFANFDFMGTMNRDFVQPCIRNTIPRLMPGGLMSVTLIRAREWLSPHRSAWDVHAAARNIGNFTDLEDARWAGTVSLVQGWAKSVAVPLELVGAVEYQHNHSPMSVLAWRRPR